MARDEAPAVSDADFATYVHDNTAFALDVYAQVGAGDKDNLFFSPHSMTQALGMTYAGANGDTATQMADALHFSLPSDALHKAADKLDLALASRATDDAAKQAKHPFKLHQTNSLWGQDGKSWLGSYLDVLASDYGSGIFELDFGSDPEGARKTINSYIEGETEGTIKELLAPGTITSGVEFVLTNAIYFEAAWAKPFDKDATKDAAFTLLSGDTATVPMMSGGEGSYSGGEDYEAVEMGYEGGELSLVAIQPLTKDAAAFSALEASLTADKLDTIMGGFSDGAAVTFPKVKLDRPISLKQTLMALGMVDAFGAADFSGMDGTPDVQIADVVHRGFVEIDEVGTKAGAATAVIGVGAAPVDHVVTFDHAFIFLIRDNQTGAVLFMGRVVDPR